MSGSLPALQENATVAADAFCRRYVQPPKRKRRRTTSPGQSDRTTSPGPRPKPGKFYRPRDHAASPFFKVVRDHFDEFERVYPEKY